MNPLQKLVPDRTFPPVEKKNSRIAFILGAPRSGTTLLRAMLAGHPELFAPPELRLLNMGNISGIQLQNCVQIVGKIAGVDDAEAFNHIAQFEDAQGIYGEFQRMAGRRLLVDKTPHYSTEPAALARAEAMFEEPLYIWLTRHPAGVVKSWKSMHPAFFWGWDVTKLNLSNERIGELTWRMCNENVESFLSGVPKARWMVVRYEDLVEKTATIAGEVCRFLGVQEHDKVLTPFDGDPARMLGIQGGGDFKFTSRNGYDTSLIDSWKGVVSPSRMDAETKAIATRLGYDVG